MMQKARLTPKADWKHAEFISAKGATLGKRPKHLSFEHFVHTTGCDYAGTVLEIVSSWTSCCLSWKRHLLKSPAAPRVPTCKLRLRLEIVLLVGSTAAML